MCQRSFRMKLTAGLNLCMSDIQGIPEVTSLRRKRPEREADHLPLSSAEVQKNGTIPPLTKYVFMAKCSIKQWTLLHDAVLKAQKQIYLNLPERYSKGFHTVRAIQELMSHPPPPQFSTPNSTF
jgi:hypothetical protein